MRMRPAFLIHREHDLPSRAATPQFIAASNSAAATAVRHALRESSKSHHSHILLCALRSFASALLFATALACSGGEAPKDHKQGTEGLTLPPHFNTAAPLAPYPRGRWRLATLEELDRSVLWVSHILLRHADTKPISFIDRYRAIEWEPNGPPPSRSRREAAVLAQKVHDDAQKAPHSFAELARKFSEDRATSGRGGSLGGTRGSQFGPAFLDALHTMKDGEISAVVESGYGFHILQRRAPPPLDTVAGSRLVVRYRGAMPIAGADAPSRSREEALQLAEELRSSAGPFDTLIRARSEHPDRAIGGYIGEWSSREPLHNGPEVEALSELQVGEISAPLDTPHGFVLLQRAPSGARAPVAVSTWVMPYDDATKVNVQRRAEKLLRQLQADPQHFSRHPEKEWTTARHQWAEGRGDLTLATIAAPLQIGEFSTQPLDTGDQLVIVRRVAPDAALQSQPPALSYELPNPSAPNMDAILTSSSPEVLANQIGILKSMLDQAVKLPAPQQEIVDSAFDDLGVAFRSSSSLAERDAARNLARANLKRDLDPQSFAMVDNFVRHWVRAQVMENPSANVN
jgi:hypothetical protein